MARIQPSPVIATFTVEQASRLTKVSERQLRAWEKDGFFIPSISSGKSKNLLVRLYSFRDLVCLRIINQLRNEAKVPLSNLREAKDKLSKFGDDMWATTTLYVLGRRVVFDNPETGRREDAANGQGVFQIPLRVASGNMEEDVKAMRKREADALGKIDTKPFGAKKPVIAGTRIPVQTIKEFADAGYTVTQIIEQYPSLTESDVRAAINFRSAA